MNGKRMCQSYEIIDSRRVGDTEVVLGYSPTEVSPYVTWKCYAYDNFQGYNYSLAHLFFKYYYSAQFLYKAWKRFRKYGAALTAATQNVEECLRSETARLMFANSEFLVLLNQAATDRAELAKLLNISESQMGYVTNAEAGHGLLRVGGAIVPFANEFPRTGALYQLWNTTPTDK